MQSYKMLNSIKSPDDLKKYKISELEQLCAEIRQKLVETVAENGGHLSSNLGIVELTVMLHYIFDCPKDSVVWDVGHQSYAHKMLTGRFNEISKIRTENGLSGFPKRSESDCDAFNAGHSSTSISAALGIAKAKELNGDDSFTIAVIGDGSFSGGIAYEGCNNAGRFKKNLIVILNDNKMSISKNVGAMARYLTSMRMKPWYLRMKKRTENLLLRTPLIGKPIMNMLKRSKLRVKKMVYKDTLFDYLGFTYYGPVDGHNLDELYNALSISKKLDEPILLHIVTTKGKGYQFAENDPKGFHGIGRFDIDSGEPIATQTSYSDIFGGKLARLAESDKNICAITAAMTLGTGLSEFAQKYKNRFFDVGIAEEHAVIFGCGLATQGKIPVFAVYSTFLQRSYDQLIHDCACQQLHMVLAIDRAGFVGEDGETHQGLFDIAMLSGIPNTAVYSPCYFDGLESSLEAAVYSEKYLAAVRYPRGTQGYRPKSYGDESINYDVYGDKTADVLIVTYGRLFSQAALAADRLNADGVKVCVLKLCRVVPIDFEALNFALNFKKIFFFEEGMLAGGIGSLFQNGLSQRSFNGRYEITAVDGEFVKQSSVARQLEIFGLDSGSIIKKIKDNR